MNPLVATMMVAAFLHSVPLAQEHPEHPQKQTQQQPPADRALDQLDALEPVTLDQVAEAITDYVTQDARLKGGYFLVYDNEDKRPIALKLDNVHRERLASLGDDMYFACTDMKTDDGMVYDVDFMMKALPEGIGTTEVSIHKKAGKPRYQWREENGVWKRVKA